MELELYLIEDNNIKIRCTISNFSSFLFTFCSRPLFWDLPNSHLYSWKLRGEESRTCAQNTSGTSGGKYDIRKVGEVMLVKQITGKSFKTGYKFQMSLQMIICYHFLIWSPQEITITLQKTSRWISFRVLSLYFCVFHYGEVNVVTMLLGNKETWDAQRVERGDSVKVEGDSVPHGNGSTQGSNLKTGGRSQCSPRNSKDLILKDTDHRQPSGDFFGICMFYNSILEKEHFSLKAQNFHDIHIHDVCV